MRHVSFTWYNFTGFLLMTRLLTWFVIDIFLLNSKDVRSLGPALMKKLCQCILHPFKCARRRRADIHPINSTRSHVSLGKSVAVDGRRQERHTYTTSGHGPGDIKRWTTSSMD